MAQGNAEDCINTFEFESETQSEKEKQNMSNNKLLKIGGILILCLLLLNFVLVVSVMNRTSKISSPSSAEDISARMNQANKTGEIVEQMKFELSGIEKWINSTEEKFESHHFQIESLLNQTKIGKQLEALENKNLELKKTHKELKEQFASLSQKLGQLKSNISSNRGFLSLTPLPENEDEGISAAAQSKSITSCSVAMEILQSPRSKNQTIYPHGNFTSLEVLCDFEVDGGGWTVIQKRSSGPHEEFNKTWIEYKNGFGSLDKNFWLGLENIRTLTKNGDQELRIQLEDFEGEKRWAKYSNFLISDSSDFYRLAIGGFYRNSTLEDSMTVTDNGQRFSTKDKDNDGYSGNCAAQWGGGGGWWFNGGCSHSNLNGRYFEKGETIANAHGIRWFHWKGYSNSFAKSEMKIRTRK